MNLFHRVVLSYEETVANVIRELSCSQMVDSHCSKQRFVWGAVLFGSLNLQKRLRDLFFFTGTSVGELVLNMTELTTRISEDCI